MAVKAVAKGVRMSPRKVGVVAALVRGRTVADALDYPEHTPRRSATACQQGYQERHRLTPTTTMATSLPLCRLSKSPSPTVRASSVTAQQLMAAPCHSRREASHIRVVVDGEKREVKKPAAAKAKPAKKEEKK